MTGTTAPAPPTTPPPAPKGAPTGTPKPDGKKEADRGEKPAEADPSGAEKPPKAVRLEDLSPGTELMRPGSPSPVFEVTGARNKKIRVSLSIEDKDVVMTIDGSRYRVRSSFLDTTLGDKLEHARVGSTNDKIIVQLKPTWLKEPITVDTAEVTKLILTTEKTGEGAITVKHSPVKKLLKTSEESGFTIAAAD